MVVFEFAAELAYVESGNARRGRWHLEEAVGAVATVQFESNVPAARRVGRLIFEVGDAQLNIDDWFRAESGCVTLERSEATASVVEA